MVSRDFRKKKSSSDYSRLLNEVQDDQEKLCHRRSLSPSSLCVVHQKSLSSPAPCAVTSFYF
ncbi:hypothetical protein NC652_008071 [Populus alba x Populus x berolinensis]|nr:hypothetical protein NC652_008071 [Populus alba x Populus x berolinensis]